jgi:hypothetical protein
MVFYGNHLTYWAGVVQGQWNHLDYAYESMRRGVSV